MAFDHWKTCRIVVLLIAALGCASSAESPSEGGGPTGLARFFDAPPDDQALVLIFRPPRRGRTGWASVYEDDEMLTRFSYHSYLAHLTEPGSHRYMVVSEAADFLDAEVEGGKVYFAEIVPRTGAWRARFSLIPYPPEHPRLQKLEAWLRKSDSITPGTRDREWHAQHAESVFEKRDAYLPKWLQKSDRPVLDQGLELDRVE